MSGGAAGNGGAGQHAEQLMELAALDAVIQEELEPMDVAGWPGRTAARRHLHRPTKKTKEEAPPEVAEFIQNLPILPNAEETAEVVRLGLASMGGGQVVDAGALAIRLARALPSLSPR